MPLILRPLRISPLRILRSNCLTDRPSKSDASCLVKPYISRESTSLKSPSIGLSHTPCSYILNPKVRNFIALRIKILKSLVGVIYYKYYFTIEILFYLHCNHNIRHQDVFQIHHSFDLLLL